MKIWNSYNKKLEWKEIVMELVVTEKASVAQAIASVLGARQRKNGYIMGNGYIVSWCVGHLVQLAQPESYCEEWKKWSYESLPMVPSEWQYEVKKETFAQFQILKKWMNDSKINHIIAATDAGREGELIFRLVYEKAGCTKPVKRLWISSMEESAIREGLLHLRNSREYDNLYYSALCRQQADWLVGLNGTRLFTVLYGGKVLKVGRVQTPTLAMLVEREEKIRNFQKESYYITHILADGIDAVTEQKNNKIEAETIAKACLNGQAFVTSVIKEQKKIAPPKLYDLTTLQRDANRLFGFTAKQTLEYAQSLYEKKLVTYPRTDSQYVTEDMTDTIEDVINAISSTIPFVPQVKVCPNTKKVMNSKNVTDHHAIIPTVELTKIDCMAVPEGERKILFLVANRLLCATGESQQLETIKAEITCNGMVFKVHGQTICHHGWKEFENAWKQYDKTVKQEDSKEEAKLPNLYEGMILENVQTKITEHFTQAPRHFTEDSLLLAMEKAGTEEMGKEVERKGLGTPATRADIIEKLVKDGFVKRENKQLLPTEDGIKLITVLPDVIKSPKLTADWENALTFVAKGEYTMQEFMNGIEEMVQNLVQTYHYISKEEKSMFGPSRTTQMVLGKCPKCGNEVVKGTFGAYCKGKCGMAVGRAMGVTLSDSQVKSMLEGQKTLIKGLTGKKGSYDVYLIPEGIEDFSYRKDGKEVKGSQYKCKIEFPKKKRKE